MPALIDYDLPNAGGGGFYEWETDPQITTDRAGFDTVKATICFKGTAAQLFALFALGAQNCPDLSSKPLYYAGPKVQESRFGFHVADLEWIGNVNGFPSHPGIVASGLAADMHILSFDFGMTTNEATFPQERGGATILQGHPDKANQPDEFIRTVKSYVSGGVTDLGAPWRIRRIGRAYTAALRGVTISDYGVLTRPPKLEMAVGAALPTMNDPHSGNINWAQYPDPQINVGAGITSAKGGWLCRNYHCTRDYQLGTKSLKAWTADYEWIERYGP